MMWRGDTGVVSFFPLFLGRNTGFEAHAMSRCDCEWSNRVIEGAIEVEEFYERVIASRLSEYIKTGICNSV
jgi:hypothetical protein